MGIKGKNIVIGVTGCIAAYKVAELVRLFITNEANVQIIMTKSAQEFITPLTLSTLSKNKVYTDTFDKDYDYDICHISLADNADLFLIAPATANVIGKIANGIADDLLTTTVMATKAPVVIAPAMNVHMWENLIVQKNIEKLKKLGYVFLEPGEGDLACGYKGKGRLQDVQSLFDNIVNLLEENKFLTGKTVTITLGGTREYFDPVRFIGNSSSGKMGNALVNEAIRLGAKVKAVSTVNVTNSFAEIIRVETAQQMLEAVKESMPDTDILIMSAAVADFAPEEYKTQKIKKENNVQEINLKLIKNPDILKEISSLKKDHQIIIGFAAETSNLLNNALDKLKSKNLDLIIANDVSIPDIGMNSDFNEVLLIFKDGASEKIARNTKESIARSIFQVLRVNMSL